MNPHLGTHSAAPTPPAGRRPTHLAVAIPAHDEVDRIAAAVEALRSAADVAGSEVAVTIACDRCTDGTVDRARGAIDGDVRFTILDGVWGAAGAARRAAARDALSRVGGDGLTTWLLSTDADTVVPEDWFTTVLDVAEAGAEAVAGIVELTRDDDWSPVVEAAFSLDYELGTHAHRHVHAANLAVRRDAYERVGGFAPLVCGEDHHMWRALHAAGYLCLPSLVWRVATSSRRTARAPGGFADTLAGLIAAGG